MLLFALTPRADIIYVVIRVAFQSPKADLVDALGRTFGGLKAYDFLHNGCCIPNLFRCSSLGG
jgi:hypothetical protein